MKNVDIKNKTFEHRKHKNVRDCKLADRISKQYICSYNQKTLIPVERNN